MKYCPNCGKKLSSGVKFCSECGTKKGHHHTDEDTETHVTWGIGWLSIILIVGLLAVLVVFVIPFPYTDIVYAQEEVPYTVEECKTDLTEGITGLVTRGIEAISEGDAKRLYEECENVVRTKKVTKGREVTKYATLYEQWTKP